MPGTYGRLKTLAAIELQVPGEHAVHDLAGIEDDRMAATLPEMSGEGAIGLLNRQFPVDDPLRAPNQLGTPQNSSCRDERLDDIAAGFGIAGQPAVLEAPTGGDPAAIGTAIADILCAAKPVDGGLEVQPTCLLGLFSLAKQVPRDEPQVPLLPWLIAEGEFGDPGNLHRFGLVQIVTGSGAMASPAGTGTWLTT